MNNLRLILLIALLPVSPMSAQSNRTATSRTLPMGIWGGDHITMTVDAAGAQIEFDCAVGAIVGPISLDSSNHFQVKGIYRSQSPAPMGADASDANNAIYSGVVKGGKLHLDIGIAGRSDHLIFELTHSQEGHIAKCA